MCTLDSGSVRIFSYRRKGERIHYSIYGRILLNIARRRKADPGILSKIRDKSRYVSGHSYAGRLLAPLLPEIKEYTGSKASLVTVPSHDTASAFLAAPSSSEDAIFLSSGTWSIMGVMADEPVLSAEAMEHGFSNEGGAFGRITLIKNIMGLWIEQESRRQWKREGKSYTFDELSAAAAEAQPLRSLINPFDPIFTPEGNMPQRIAEYCMKTGQAVPESVGETVRCILDESCTLLQKNRG